MCSVKCLDNGSMFFSAAVVSSFEVEERNPTYVCFHLPLT